MNKPFDLDDTQKQESPLAEVGGVTFLDSSKYNIAEATAKAFASLDVCYFKGHGAKQGRVINMLELVTMIENPIAGNVTEHTPENVKAVKTALPLVTPFVNRTTDGKTKEDALAAKYSCIVIDFDHEQVRTLEGTIGLLKANHDYTGAILGFTTSSHTLNNENAFKIIIPLAVACDVHQYEALSVGLMKLLDTDPAQARKQQGFYAPCDMLSPSVYLSLIDDGDSTLFSPQCGLWQQAIRTYQDDIEQQQQAAIATSSKPRPKAATAGNSQNIFELINKSYDMVRLLENAGHKRLGRKWLSPHSTSGFAGGLIFDTPQGQRFYSHSSSCPLGKDANNGHSLDIADVLAVTCYAGDYSAMIQEQAKQLDQDGQKQRQRDYMQAQEQAIANPTKQKQWGEPLPLVNEDTTATPYPITAFPPIVQRAIEKAAYYNHVPLALAGQTALGLMVYIAQEHAQAHSDRSHKGQPCSFGTFSIFESGGGKDETRNLLADSVIHLEKKSISEFVTEYKEYKALPAKVRNNTPAPDNPQTLFEKGTTQGIVKAMSNSVMTSFAWQTTEGAQVIGGYSLTSETMGESLGVINQLIDRGRTSSVLKGADEAEFVIDARFSVDITIQDVMARKALNNEIFKQQGILARFMFAAPKPLPFKEITQESRTIFSSQDHDIVAFNEFCERLKSPPQKEDAFFRAAEAKRKLFAKDDEADSLHIEYENYIKSEVEKGGKYHSIRPNALRTIQYSLRVATVLAYFTTELDKIDKQTMQGAISLCLYSLDEWIRYYKTYEATDSELLLTWLKNQKDKKVLKSKIATHATPARLRPKAIRDAALDHLIDAEYVKVEQMGDKFYVVLNPNI